MLDFDISSKLGFIYGKEAMENFKKSNIISFKIDKLETIDDMQIYTIAVLSYSLTPFKFELCKITDLKCLHGLKLNFATVNRLPQEGWQELIDCWSCHDNEFKSMLELDMKPRKNGILASNFYIIASDNVLPNCCKAKVRCFYNELIHNYSDNMFIFKFFEEYFFHKSSIVLKNSGLIYEIKLFYRCGVVHNNICKEAFKVGYKISEKPEDEDSYIGEYFKNMIFKE